MKPKSILASLLALAASALPAQDTLIELATDNTALVLVARPGAPLLLRHYGARVSDTDAFLATGLNRGLQFFPAFGGEIVNNTALDVIHSDGSLVTELIYESHEFTQPAPDRTQLTLHLRDKTLPFFADLRLTAHKRENVITQNVTLRHAEPAPVRVQNLASGSLSLQSDAYYLTHFHGDWAREMQLTEEKLTPGAKLIEEHHKDAKSTMRDNPSFLLTLRKPADEDSGETYAAALAWNGNYRIKFDVVHDGRLHITAGTNPFLAERLLAPGETLTTPDLILTYSDTGRGQASRNLHDYARANALAHPSEPRAILLNSWEGAYFKFDENVLTGMMDAAADAGIEMFVLDDGWFGNKYPRDNDKAGLGDWQVNTKKLPRGIGYLADYAVQKGLRFGIWIEPEMVNPKSELAEKHPDWILKSGTRDNPTSRTQWILDLANPEVQDFVVKVFDDTVALSKNITYIKWDANRSIMSPGSAFLPNDRQTHLWDDYTRGLDKVYQRIRQKHPDITIQLCSSGGARVNYGALRYHDEFWTSDNTSAHERVLMQYGTSMIYPPIAMAAHVSASPNHQTKRLLPMKFRFDVAMSGRLGVELNPSDIPDADMPAFRQGIATYKRIRPIVQQGDLYRLHNPFDGDDRAALMYVTKDKTASVLFAYNMRYNGREHSLPILLRGLDPAKKYKVEELNPDGKNRAFKSGGKTFSGDFLIKTGLTPRWTQRPYTSVVLLLTEAP